MHAAHHHRNFCVCVRACVRACVCACVCFLLLYVVDFGGARLFYILFFFCLVLCLPFGCSISSSTFVFFFSFSFFLGGGGGGGADGVFHITVIITYRLICLVNCQARTTSAGKVGRVGLPSFPRKGGGVPMGYRCCCLKGRTSPTQAERTQSHELNASQNLIETATAEVRYNLILRLCA